MTNEQLQEYWDACLIRGWRRFLTLGDVVLQWQDLTREKFADHQTLKRIPIPYFPNVVGVRIFTAQFLPKINDYLNDHAPDKDVALLKKLQASSYDTLKKSNIGNMEKELKAVQRQVKDATNKSVFDTNNYHDRNHGTDWNKVKGSVRIRRAK